MSENLDNIEKSPSEEDKLRSLIYKNLKEYKQNNYKSEVSAINGKFIYILLNYIIKYLETAMRMNIIYLYQLIITILKISGVENGLVYGNSLITIMIMKSQEMLELLLIIMKMEMYNLNSIKVTLLK